MGGSTRRDSGFGIRDAWGHGATSSACGAVSNPESRIANRGWRRGILATLVLALASACADFEAPEDPAFGLPNVVVADPSFSRDVQPILTVRCATGGCHSAATQQSGLNLSSSASYDALVNRLSVSSSERLLLVEPGDAANSWLVRRIEADPARREHLPRMPLAITPLTDNQIATIANWINQGAKRD